MSQVFLGINNIMILKKKIIFLLLIFLFNVNFNTDIEIKFKVDNQIITNFDIFDEVNYLIFIRPELSKLTKKELENLAENSLIREIIKKKELDKIFKNIDKTRLIEDVKLDLYKFKKVKNENELIKLIKKNNINYSNIIEKVKNEKLWNELVYRKFNKSIKIDENYLRKQLVDRRKKIKKFEYNLSEILFELDNSVSLENKYKNIKEEIKNNGFESAAIKYSIANSSKNNGNIGWIKETLLSNKISDMLRKIDINEISTPIRYPNGYLVLKINNKKELKQKIDLDRELKDLIKYEKNKQLNQFSLLFYKRIKQNTIINEY